MLLSKSNQENELQQCIKNDKFFHAFYALSHISFMALYISILLTIKNFEYLLSYSNFRTETSYSMVFSYPTCDVAFSFLTHQFKIEGFSGCAYFILMEK